MKIFNESGQYVGKVNETKDPNIFEYNGAKVYASGIASACAKVCKSLGEGYFYLMFTI